MLCPQMWNVPRIDAFRPLHRKPRWEDTTVKMPKWLRWTSDEPSKADTLKKIRQQTDQRLRQQEVKKEQQDAQQIDQSPAGTRQGQ